MYNIPMGMYSKDFLSFIWKDKYHRVNESLQLLNCLEWHLKHKKFKNKFCYLKDDVMQTSFLSSASFNAHNDFDLIRFNHILNELWFDNKFDSMENYPHDYSPSYIENILLENWNKENTKKWLNWSNKFQKSFAALN